MTRSEIVSKYRGDGYLCRIDDDNELVRGLCVWLVHDFGDALWHYGGEGYVEMTN